MASITSTVILCACLILQAYSMPSSINSAVHRETSSSSTYTKSESKVEPTEFAPDSREIHKNAVTTTEESVPYFVVDIARRSFSRKQLAQPTKWTSVSVNITDADLQGLEATNRVTGACHGPGTGAGLAITPIRILFSPPFVWTCTSPGPSGPPFPFLCRYGCGKFWLFFVKIRYRYFVCGSMGTAVVGFNGFSFRVNALQIPLVPGPIVHADVCSI